MSTQLPDITFGPPAKISPAAQRPVRGMPPRAPVPATVAEDITFEAVPSTRPESGASVTIDGKHYVVQNRDLGLPPAQLLKRALAGPFPSIAAADAWARERSQRMSIEARFAGVPTPAQAFGAEFVRGAGEQVGRIGTRLQQYLRAAAAEISAGAERMARESFRTGGSRVIARPLPGAGQITAGSMAATIAPARAIGDVVIPDTMDLMVSAHVPQEVIIAYGTIAQTAFDFTVDPTFQILLTRAIPKAAAEIGARGEAATRAAATAALRRQIAAEVEGLDFHNLPVRTRQQLVRQQEALDQALQAADRAVTRRVRAGKKPVAAPEAAPVAAAPSPPVPVPEPGPALTPKVARTPKGLLARTKLTAEELTELEGHGWTRQQVGQMTPQRARAALEEGRAIAEREAHVMRPPEFAKPAAAPPPPPAPPVEVPRFAAGDQVVYGRDGELYRVERVGPRGYGLVDAATGRRRVTVMRGELTADPELLRKPLVETAPTPTEARLVGQEAAAPAPEISRQLGVIPEAAGRAEIRFGEGLQRGDPVIYGPDPRTKGFQLDPAQVGTVVRTEISRGVPYAEIVYPSGRHARYPAAEFTKLPDVTPTGKALAASAELQRRLETESMAAKQAERVRARRPETELTIGEFARSQGGVSIEKSPDLAGELRSLQKQKITPPGLVTTRSPRSRGADDLAKTLNELGFRKPDGSEIAGADLPRLLEDEYGGRLGKDLFLHPASLRRVGFTEADIADQQFRAELQGRGVLTRRLEEYFQAPRPVKRAIVEAVKRAEAQMGREPQGEKELVELGERAARIYNTELRPKLAKADQEVLSPKFFHEFYIAREVDPGEVTLDVIRNEDMNLSERLDEANRYVDEAADALGRKPKLDEQGALRAHLFGELWDTAVQPVRDLREIVTGFARGAIKQADGVVAKMGPEGRELVSRNHAVDDTFRLAAGKIEGPLEGLRIRYSKIHGARAWVELGEKFRLLREGSVPVKLTPEEAAIYQIVDHYLGRTPTEGVVARARAEGIPAGFIGTQEVPGGLGVVTEAERGYWPIRLNFDVAQQRMGEAVQAIMERTHADFERAQLMLQRLLGRQRTGRPFGNLERTREEWAPYFVRKPAWQEFHEYVYGAERRIAETRHWGLADEHFNELQAAIRRHDVLKNTNDADFAGAWFDAITRRAPREVYAEAVARKTADLQVASKMVLSVIANSTQPINNLLVVNTTTFLRALRKIMSPITHEAQLDFARRTGAVLETHLKQLLYETGGAELGEKVVTRTGFLTVEGGNRLFTAVVGREWAHDLAAMLRKTRPGTRRFRFIQRHLEQIGLDADTLRAQGYKLTEDQERLAGLKLSDLTQFPINPGTLPLFWSSPWWKLATQFKTFAYKQGVLVGQAVLGEARRGNLKPLVIFLTVFPLVGEGVADLRLLLRNLPRSVTDPGGVLREGRPQNYLVRYAANMGYVGGLGLVSDFVRAIERRMPVEAVASFLGGPTFGSELMQAVLAGASVYQGRIGEGARRLARQLVGLTITPGLTAALGLPGALAGEGFESLFISRRALPSRRRRRPRRTR